MCVCAYVVCNSPLLFIRSDGCIETKFNARQQQQKVKKFFILPENDLRIAKKCDAAGEIVVGLEIGYSIHADDLAENPHK